MKNNKFSKIYLIILALSLCIGAAFAMSVSAEDAPTPVISSKNIEYNTQFSLMYAVPASTVSEGASVTLYLHAGTAPAKEDYAKGTAYTVSEATPKGTAGLDYDAYIFTTDGIAAKAFATEFYVVAKDNNTGNFSTLTRYSVAEYLYERLSTSDITNEQKMMYNGAITFATGVQLSVGNDKLNEVTDADKLISNLRYVVIEGGKIDGYNTGVYAKGTSPVLVADKADAAAKWTFSYLGEKGVEIADDEINQTELTIPETEGLIKVGVTYQLYKTGTNTFDGYLTTDTLSGKGMAVSAGTGEFAEEAGQGKVLKALLNGSGSMIRFNQQYSGLAADNASAYEISFDIKFVNAVQNHGLYFRIYDEESDPTFRLACFPAADGSAIIRLDESSSGGNQIALTDVQLNGWVNIKFVIYESDTTKCYLSINGNEYVLPAREAYPYTFGNATHIRMVGMSSVSNDTFLVDNLFAGYTTETK